jgi:hypothetical protein
MKLLCRIALVTILCVLALLAWLLHFYWPLDLLRGSQIVAEEYFGNGYALQVRQSWGSDFYFVRLIVRAPDGRFGWTCIDGDDVRWWFGKIVQDYNNNRALIYNVRTLRGVYDFSHGTFYRVNPHNSNDWMEIEVESANTNSPAAIL